MIGDHINLAALAGLWAIVAFGSVVPVLPTGAAVSAAAALAGPEHPLALLAVVATGAAGAYVGDIITYGALSAAGEPLARRLGWLRPEDDANRLRRLRATIERHALRTLVVSRLVPAGRIPVLLVACLTGYSWYRFAGAAVAAVILWAVCYSLIGLAGSSLLPDTTSALIAAVLGAILLTGALHLVRRLRRH